MVERNRAVRPSIKYLKMDCQRLHFADRSLDLVIDKATFDTLLCYEKPYLTIARYLKQVYRILRLGGKFLLITTGEPQRRLFHLKRTHLGFNIEISEIKRMTDDSEVTHYAYICTKSQTTEKV